MPDMEKLKVQEKEEVLKAYEKLDAEMRKQLETLAV
jgi:hypothetical protein